MTVDVADVDFAALNAITPIGFAWMTCSCSPMRAEPRCICS